MPYSYFENGEHRGIVHDIIAQMERDLGITFDVRETPTNAALFAQLSLPCRSSLYARMLASTVPAFVVKPSLSLTGWVEIISTKVFIFP